MAACHTEPSPTLRTPPLYMSIAQEGNNSAVELAMTVADEEISAMLKAGVHIGRVSSKTHPGMAPFIFANRTGVAIFDLIKTKEKLARAEEFIRKLARDKKIILFVGTKPAAYTMIKTLNEKHGIPVVAGRWVGGTLTNWKVVSGRIQELERLHKEKAEGGFKKYTKKEIMKQEEKISHLEKTFGGLRSLRRIPDALFVADADEDELAIREARRMRIPTIAIVNSNRNPEDVEYPIPANDNSIPSVTYILQRIEKAFQEGQKEASLAPSDKEQATN